MLQQLIFFIPLFGTIYSGNVANSGPSSDIKIPSPIQYESSEKYRLLFCPLMMKSHADNVAVVAVEMASRGHKVHYIVGYSFQIPGRITKYNTANPSNQLIVEFYERPALDFELDFDSVIQIMNNAFLFEQTDLSQVLDKLNDITSIECERETLHNDKLFNKLNDLHFDMVIVDVLPVVRCMLLIPHRLHLPWIAMTDAVEPAVVRVPYIPSFVPAFLTSYSDEMTFWERIKNTFYMIVQALIVMPEPSDRIITKYQEYGEFKNLKELSLKTLFWITSRDNTLDYVKPSMPNMVDAGGLTIGPGSGNLDTKLIEFISKSKKGIVVVSFGSGILTLPKLIKDKFIAAFKMADEFNFVWRVSAVEDEVLPGNVMRFDWLPQNDLLAHNSTKAFISHCGNNGQFEAIYHAVPIIGFPIAAEQPYNGKRIEKRGYGLLLRIHKFTPQQLVDAIRTVVEDGSFKRRISKASQIYRSAMQEPKQRAAYWIEHVVKFGVDHLRGNTGLAMSIFEYYCVDVFAFCFLVLAAASLIVCLVLRSIYRLTCGSSVKNKKD